MCVFTPVSRLSSPLLFSFYASADHRGLHSFPTRRSSDLARGRGLKAGALVRDLDDEPVGMELVDDLDEAVPFLAEIDRKSTRLNSSHRCISYAVFCLKKKKENQQISHSQTIYYSTNTPLC